MNNRIERICVVGAGPSGIVASKELKEKGFDVQCFEKSDSIGGVFSKGGNKSYYTLLNVSKFFISFSDFPPLDKEVCRWTWTEYGDYLERYVKTHQLAIQRRKEILRIDRVDRKYVVAIHDLESDQREEQLFDAVVICSGLHHAPKPFPFQIKQQEMFNVPDLTEEAVASMKDKNILLFGLGESTADVIKILPQTSKIMVVTRRKRCFGPNIIKNYPPDLSVSRVWQSLPTFVYRFVNICLARFGTNQVDKRIAELSHASHLTCTSDFLVKNSGFAEGLLYRDISVKKEIKEIREGEVTFSDDETLPVDVIVNCAGFDRKFPDLSVEGEPVGRIEFRQLYKHLLFPELGPTLSFIGYAKPTIGNIPATAEMQARYMAMILSGEKPLPADLKTVICRDADYYRKSLSVDNEQLVHYMNYLDSLADQIGCRPHCYRFLLRLDFRLLWYCFMGSQNPYQYRLFGPNSDYKRNREIIVGLPVMTNVIHLPVYLAVEAGRFFSRFTRKLVSALSP